MASTFPADTPSYDPFSTPITLAALQHTLRHRQMEEDIVAIAEKVGETNSVDPTSHDYRIDALEDDVAALQLDKADSTDVTSEIAAAIAAVKEALYPVGSIYTNAAVSTNPATLLGFGTWAAYADGRVLVGKAASGTFATGGATGGAETHTLTTAEIPAHTHGSQGGTAVLQFHGAGAATVLAGASGTGGGTSGDRDSYRSGGGDIGGAYSADSGTINWSHTHASVGSNGAHNNLQPYVVVYMWKRTA